MTSSSRPLQEAGSPDFLVAGEEEAGKGGSGSAEGEGGEFHAGEGRGNRKERQTSEFKFQRSELQMVGDWGSAGSFACVDHAREPAAFLQRGHASRRVPVGKTRV
jgi:hypothetical protein